MGRTKAGFSNKLTNDAVKYKAICLGIDQSYANTGLAIVGIKKDGDLKVLHYESVPGINKHGNPTAKLEYRAVLVKAIKRIIADYRAYSNLFYVISEAMRLHSQGQMMVNSLLTWGALQGAIADYLYNYHDIVMRIADTRAWKAKVLGTSKPADKSPKGVDPKKWPTIKYVKEQLGVDKQTIAIKLSDRAKKFTWKNEAGKWTYNTDICDAICIAIYGLKTPLTALQLTP